ncbi:CABIT domain [Trinorchestia longiramus]|nr:CABIT domain [Trinorchestia longiramus]
MVWRIKDQITHFAGWFSVVRGSGTSATAYTSITQVVKCRTTTFLTRYDLPAIKHVKDGAGGAVFHKSTVKGGEVLKLMSVVRHGKEGDLFAQCVNYQHQVLLVPLNAAGKFYCTAEKNSHDTDKVYLISQLLKAFQLPLTVKLVCGYMPRTPCAFTGILRLLRCQKESVLLACTMTSRAEATLLEMDLNSNFLLSPILDPVFSKSPIYLKTLSYCDDEADEWQRQIKVTHHVAEQRSRSLTRSFSDKFVDGPLLGTPHGHRSVTSFCTLDRVKPRRSVADNSIGRLATKVMKMKENRKKDEICKESDCLNQSLENINYPRTKLFEKQRSLSKQNTYVQDINRRNLPLPEPATKSNKLNIKYSLNSLKRTKKIKNRPLPTPTELVVDTPEDSHPDSMTYKFIKTSKDGIEYCRVLDESNSFPAHFSLDDFEEEKEERGENEDTENLYSEIDDSMANDGMDLDFSDEERDSASYSNGNSSNENSIDTKISRDEQMFLKFRERASRNLEVKALVHAGYQKSPKIDDQIESDHYATLTLNEDDDDDDDDTTEENLLTDGISHHFDRKRSERSLRFVSMKGDFCDSLENVSTSLPDTNLKTFVDPNGTMREKYIMRQRRHNIYETLDEVRESSAEDLGAENVTDDKCLIVDESDVVTHRVNQNEKSVPSDMTINSSPQTQQQEKTESAEKYSSSYTSSVTLIETDCSKEQDSSFATKMSSDLSKTTLCDTVICEESKPGLTSAYSIADLCSEDEEGYGIQVRGNTILIKVSDESPKDTVFDAEAEKPLDSKSNLKKCSSVSSINILLDDNEDFLVLMNETDGDCAPSVMTINETSNSNENFNETSYCKEACVSISIIGGTETMTTAKISDDIVDEMYGHQTEETYKSIGILSPNNELLINTAEVHFNDQPSSDLDRKSLDSGNASDEVEDHEDSFDADSLAEESVEPYTEQNTCQALEKAIMEELEFENGDEFDAIDGDDDEDVDDADDMSEIYEYRYAQRGRDIELEEEQIPILTSKYEISVMEPIMEEDSYESEPSESMPNSPGRHVYQNQSISASANSSDVDNFLSLSNALGSTKSSPDLSKENQYENMDTLTHTEIFTSQQTVRLETSHPEICRSSLKSVEPLDLEYPFLMADAFEQDARRSCMTMPRPFSSRYKLSQMKENLIKECSAPLYQNIERSEDPPTSMYENVSPSPSVCTPVAIYENTSSPPPEHRTVTSFSFISLSPRSILGEETVKNDCIHQTQKVTADLPRESLKSFYNSPFINNPRTDDDQSQSAEGTTMQAFKDSENSKVCLGVGLIPGVLSSIRNDPSRTNTPDNSTPDSSNPFLDFRKVSSLSSDSGCLSGDDSDSPVTEHQTKVEQS